MSVKAVTRAAQMLSGKRSKSPATVEQLLEEEEGASDLEEEVVRPGQESPSTARAKLEELLAEDSSEEGEVGGSYEVVDRREALALADEPTAKPEGRMFAVSAISRRVQSLRPSANHEEPKKKPRRTEEEILELERKVELLKQHVGLNDDELDWKLAATRTKDPFGLAVRKREEFEGEYDRLMWHQSKLEALVRMCDDRRVLDALTGLAKACREPRHPPEAAEASPGGAIEAKLPEEEEQNKKKNPKQALAGALGSALANRGRGGRGGGGGLMAAIAARGGRGRGVVSSLQPSASKKPKTVASCRQALENAKRRSRQDIERLPVADLPEFRIVDDALAEVLECGVSDESRARCASLCDKAKLDIEHRATAAKSQLEDLSKNLLEVEDDLEKWRKREAEAPNRTSALAAQEEVWAEREKIENAVALAVMRTLVPPNVAKETAESLRLRAARRIAEAYDKQKGASGSASGEDTSSKRALSLAAKWGGLYTHELAQRIKQCKPLHWVQAHPDEVAKANFLAGAGADAFKNLADYDIVELRAIYACCPPKFELDSSGAKAAWRASLVDRLRELTARERRESVSAGWDGVNDRRKVVRLPPLEAKHRRHSSYYYPGSAELEARTKKHDEARRRVEQRRSRVAELEAQLAEAKTERDAAFVDARSEYLQHHYGRDLLKKLAREADDLFRKLSSELGTDSSATGARADFRRAAQAVANAVPSETDHAALRRLLEKCGLDKVDLAADAVDLNNLRQRVAQVLGTEVPTVEALAEDPRDLGRLIRGPFFPFPELQRTKTDAVVKKLSDAEEAEMRKKEVLAATASKKNDDAKRAIWGEKQASPEASVPTNTASTRPTSAQRRATHQHPQQQPRPLLEPVQPKSRRLSQLLAAQQSSEEEEAGPERAPSTDS